MSLHIQIDIDQKTPRADLIRYSRVLCALGDIELDFTALDPKPNHPLPSVREPVTLPYLNNLISDQMKKNVLTREQLDSILKKENVETLLKLNDVDEKTLRRIEFQLLKLHKEQ